MFAPKLQVAALAAQLADRLVVLALLPMLTVAAFVAPRLVVPAPVVSTVTAPVPVDCKLRVVPEVLALIIGFAPPKVRFPPCVTAPAALTVYALPALMRLVWKVPLKVMPFTMLFAVVAAILMPFVAAIKLPVAVSLFATFKIEVTVLSVGALLFWASAMFTAAELTAPLTTEEFWVNWKSVPKMLPVLATLACELVVLKTLPANDRLVVLALVVVILRAAPLVRLFAVTAKASVVVPLNPVWMYRPVPAVNVKPMLAANVVFWASEIPPEPAWIVVAEVPVVEPKIVLWSVAFVPRLQVVVPDPQLRFTIEPAPVAPSVNVPPVPCTIWIAVVPVPPLISVVELALVLPMFWMLVCAVVPMLIAPPLPTCKLRAPLPAAVVPPLIVVTVAAVVLPMLTSAAAEVPTDKVPPVPTCKPIALTPVPPWMSVWVAAVVLPIPTVVVLVVPTLTVPAPLLLSVSVPVPFDCKVMPVLVVLALIVGLAPLKVRAVELRVTPLIEPLVVTAPFKLIPPLPLWITVLDTPVVEPI